MNNVGAEIEMNLKILRRRAAGPSVRSAATAAGRAGETATKMALQLYTHTEGTPTPSPPGSPPAKISGALARSMQRTPTVLPRPGVAESTYGPTAVYGIVHEFGMTIHSTGPWPLRNTATGQVFGRQVTIPQRAFMRPTVAKLAESGFLAEVIAAAFAKSLLA
ncbi:MAG TPA: hypothetical protein VFQ44_01985 [Streptosporangiaceae bacterium]|nr:hypothetical protein [Streptosporangiaceae bacterium]